VLRRLFVNEMAVVHQVFANCIATGRALCHTCESRMSIGLRQSTRATSAPKHLLTGSFASLQAPAPSHLRPSMRGRKKSKKRTPASKKRTKKGRTKKAPTKKGHPLSAPLTFRSAEIWVSCIALLYRSGVLYRSRIAPPYRSVEIWVSRTALPVLLAYCSVPYCSAVEIWVSRTGPVPLPSRTAPAYRSRTARQIWVSRTARLYRSPNMGVPYRSARTARLRTARLRTARLRTARRTARLEPTLSRWMS
jgi:hypothetical protein